MERLTIYKILILNCFLLMFLTVCVNSKNNNEFNEPSFLNSNLSILETEFLKTKYNLVNISFNNDKVMALDDNLTLDQSSGESSDYKYKSPAKAFFLSLAIPGLGQYYYGSKIKPLFFLGAEISTWAYHIKWHNEGNDITDEFEAYNRAHWSRVDYEQKYLNWTYQITDDDDAPPGTPGISHHLPDTRTQQYYEMTGKYNQFSWGWDDAVLNGNSIDNYSSISPPLPVMGDSSSTPFSQNRLDYEERRFDANKKFDKATKMLFVSIANRLLSSFEAFFTTKSKNSKMKTKSKQFSSLKFGARLKSVYSKRDTPYFTVKYRF